KRRVHIARRTAGLGQGARRLEQDAALLLDLQRAGFVDRDHAHRRLDLRFGQSDRQRHAHGFGPLEDGERRRGAQERGLRTTHELSGAHLHAFRRPIFVLTHFARWRARSLRMTRTPAGRTFHEASQPASAPGAARRGGGSRESAPGGARRGDGESSAAPMVRQLVSFGFDDNAYADGIEWALAMMRRRKHADGTPLYASFFVTAMYLDAPTVVAALQDALAEGHE